MNHPMAKEIKFRLKPLKVIKTYSLDCKFAGKSCLPKHCLLSYIICELVSNRYYLNSLTI